MPKSLLERLLENPTVQQIIVDEGIEEIRALPNEEIIEILKNHPKIDFGRLVGDSSQQEVNLDKSIEDLDISVRCFNVLKNGGIYTLKGIVEKEADDLFQLKNMGEKTILEINELLASFGFPRKSK